MNLQAKPQPTPADVDIQQYEVLIEQHMRRTVKVLVTADAAGPSPKLEARQRALAAVPGVKWEEFWQDAYAVGVKGPL